MTKPKRSRVSIPLKLCMEHARRRVRRQQRAGKRKHFVPLEMEDEDFGWSSEG